ncbi:GreA/GreB family elongation factor [Hydrogenophaga sp. BPS33]|uniref:GreA/GreB family elongation factor n=1 Tax=Hydrogenophaga sp. BPS33 TaxID=2651974 RepID=UPI001320379B|nr:GreA/GreB family elongation factor [Hydrogenophaga sp. BPS33]QHE84274.1 transcription elongation factor GreAB [Hydrogenophaga sp. BPS33]
MQKVLDSERMLTELDFARLKNLPAAQVSTDLLDTLESLEQVPSQSIPADVVTMYSQVMVADLQTGKQQKLTLCYPADAEPHVGFISVLSPVGASLIGQRVGAIARWQTPNGDQCAAEVVELLFQPEASGDYTT